MHGVILSASSAHSPLHSSSCSGGELHPLLLCNPCYWDCIRSILGKYKCYVTLFLPCLSALFRSPTASPTLTPQFLGVRPCFIRENIKTTNPHINLSHQIEQVCTLFVPVSTRWNWYSNPFLIFLLYFNLYLFQLVYGFFRLIFR